MALTPKQAAFVAAYDGTAPAWKAAQAAGYGGDARTLATTASRLLRNADIAAEISKRTADVAAFKPEVVALVLTRTERQAWWSTVVRDNGADLALRLRASELLAKSEGDFLERVEVEGKLTLEDLVLAARAKP